MDRIDGAGYVVNNGLRQFQDQNLASGIQGTEVTAAYMTDLQEELVGGIISALGISPTIGQQRQVQQALWRIFGGNVTTFTATGALTADNAGLVLVNATSGNVVLTLPAAASAGGMPLPFRFVRTDSSTNTVTIAVAGSDVLQPGSQTSATIAGLGTLMLGGDGASNWQVMGSRRPPNQIVMTSSETYTPTPGMVWAMAKGKGAGGGGGGAYNGGGASASAAGGGGGEGCTAISFLTAAMIGASQAVTIGGPGAAGAYNGTAGDGGTTSLGSLLSASGGYHGGAANGAGTGGLGGAGGSTGVGDLIIPGACGGIGSYTATGPESGFGGGAGGGYTVGQPGNAGVSGAGSAGGGGSGASSGSGAISKAGGAGASGYLEIIEFFG